MSMVMLAGARLRAAAGALALLATAACASTDPAQLAIPHPVYRDPVHDGAADVSIVRDAARGEWRMFYTNRRANVVDGPVEDVAWVHATRIGMATSTDGMNWTYRGVAAFPEGCTGVTEWAPEVQSIGGVYHMWLTVVPGVFRRWGLPEATSHVRHMVSRDLDTWTCEDVLDLGSNRVIDASVQRVGDSFRLWFKDERQGSRIFAADSADLRNWTRLPEPVTTTAGEGPKAFTFAEKRWLVFDTWKGLGVLRSDDAATWEEAPERLLSGPGTAPTDRAKGQHPDVLVVRGDTGAERAILYYFTHQSGEPEAEMDPIWHRRTVIHAAELVMKDGWLHVDRDAPAMAPVSPR